LHCVCQGCHSYFRIFNHKKNDCDVIWTDAIAVQNNNDADKNSPGPAVVAKVCLGNEESSVPLFFGLGQVSAVKLMPLVVRPIAGDDGVGGEGGGTTGHGCDVDGDLLPLALLLLQEG
jgi:hypothetical protein